MDPGSSPAGPATAILPAVGAPPSILAAENGVRELLYDPPTTVGLLSVLLVVTAPLAVLGYLVLPDDRKALPGHTFAALLFQTLVVAPTVIAAIGVDGSFTAPARVPVWQTTVVLALLVVVELFLSWLAAPPERRYSIPVGASFGALLVAILAGFVPEAVDVDVDPGTVILTVGAVAIAVLVASVAVFASRVAATDDAQRVGTTATSIAGAVRPWHLAVPVAVGAILVLVAVPVGVLPVDGRVGGIAPVAFAMAGVLLAAVPVGWLWYQYRSGDPVAADAVERPLARVAEHWYGLRAGRVEGSSTPTSGIVVAAGTVAVHEGTTPVQSVLADDDCVIRALTVDGYDDETDARYPRGVGEDPRWPDLVAEVAAVPFVLEGDEGAVTVDPRPWDPEREERPAGRRADPAEYRTTAIEGAAEDGRVLRPDELDGALGDRVREELADRRGGRPPGEVFLRVEERRVPAGVDAAVMGYGVGGREFLEADLINLASVTRPFEVVVDG